MAETITEPQQHISYTKWRYHTDPEYKELVKARNKEHREKLRIQGEYEEYKEHLRANAKKYYADPDNRARKQQYDRDRYWRLKQERLKAKEDQQTEQQITN